MKKKVLWILVSCVMALSLVIASCGPAEEEAEVEVGEEEIEVGEGVVEVGEEEEEAEVEEVSPDKPKYGGTTYVALAWDISNWANGLEFC